MPTPKIVTYLSNRREGFIATVVGDRGNGYLNLEIKKPGGRTQRIINVPKNDRRDKHPKFCWFEPLSEPKVETKVETKPKNS